MFRADYLGFGDELTQDLIAATGLCDLGLTDLPITDLALESLRGLRDLKELDICGTRVTYEAAQALHTGFLPGCRISDNWCCGCLAIEPISQE